MSETCIQSDLYLQNIDDQKLFKQNFDVKSDGRTDDGITKALDPP